MCTLAFDPNATLALLVLKSTVPPLLVKLFAITTFAPVTLPPVNVTSPPAPFVLKLLAVARLPKLALPVIKLPVTFAVSLVMLFVTLILFALAILP